MKALSNTTPLIYLAKLSKLFLLKKLFNKILISPKVWAEILKGKELNKPEVSVIENLIEENFLSVNEPKKIKKIETLHAGEQEIISLALELNIKNVLIDDKEAVKICELLDLKVIRTTSLLLKFLKQNLISFNEFEELLVELSKEGYFLSAEVFNFLLNEAKKIKSKV